MLQEELLMSQLSPDKVDSSCSAQALMKLFAVSSHYNVWLQNLLPPFSVFSLAVL